MTTLATEEVKKQMLTLSDRCDANCSAAALVIIKGIVGELMFCGHHYSKFENSEQMKKFAFEVIDERWTVAEENRLKD